MPRMRPNETEHQKQNRLARDREYQRNKKEADETEEQKTRRLARDREQKRKKREEGNMIKRQTETKEQRESRLARDRKQKKTKRAEGCIPGRIEEIQEQRECRLEREKQRKKRNREARNTQGNLQDHEDEILQKEFEDKIEHLRLNICDVCKRQSMAFSAQQTFDKCSKKSSPNLFTYKNRMDPGIRPKELLDLTPLEELLIAKVHPVLSVYKTKGQKLHYEGHVINFSQDVKSFSRRLPNIEAARDSIITVQKKGQGGDKPHSDFRVRGLKVQNALLWLKQNNQYYGDIEIDEKSLESLPEDGTLSSIVCIECENMNFEDDAEGMVYTTNVPNLPVQNQAEMINKVLDRPVDWPEIKDAPIDEFRTAGYIACAFPALFPYSDADLRQGRLKKIGEDDYFKFLMSYYDGRFAKHPRFPFFAMNSTLRWSALNQGNVFIKRSNLAGTSIEDLKEIMKSKTHMTKNIMFYGSTIRGTKAYWYKRCGELLSMVEQLGTPTVFFTLSAADLHWPDLFRLLKPGSEENTETISASERTRLMCKNPLIVASFFEKRGTYFIEHIMKKKFKIVDFWYRYEWQHRGSPHIHGLFWMEGAPSVDNLDSKSEGYHQDLIKYLDGLGSAWNPDQMLTPEQINPCQKRLI